MKKTFYIILLSVFSNPVFADFIQSENMRKAYTHIINLEFDLGRKYIDLEKISNPENGLILLNENYIDLDIGTWIKYVSHEGKYRTGGVLINNKAPEYLVLKNP